MAFVAPAASQPISPVGSTTADSQSPPVTPPATLRLTSIGLDTPAVEPSQIKRGLSALAALYPVAEKLAVAGVVREQAEAQQTSAVRRQRLNGKQAPPAAYHDEAGVQPKARATAEPPSSAVASRAAADEKKPKAKARPAAPKQLPLLPDSRAVRRGSVSAQGRGQSSRKQAKTEVQSGAAGRTTSERHRATPDPPLLVTTRPKRAPQAASLQKMVSGNGAKASARGSNKLIKKAMSAVTKGDVRRIARRAGCQRVATAMYGEARNALRTFLDTVLKDVTVYTEAGKKKTVSSKEVIYSLRRQGRTIYGL